MTKFILLSIPFALLYLAGLFVCLIHGRRRVLNAGTVPYNFPPESVIPIGGIATGNKLGNTAAFATTVFFTAPTSGYYLLAWAVRIDVTDGAGQYHPDGHPAQ